MAKELPFAIFSFPNTDVVNLFYQKNNKLYTSNKLDFEGFVLAPFQWDNTFSYIPNSHQLTVSKADLIACFSVGYSNKLAIDTLEEQQQYVALVAQTIDYIKKEKVAKIVCSRKKEIAIALDSLKTYIAMLAKYPFAFNYVFEHTALGKWMGASPETLLSYADGVLKTVSLAGTQAFDKTKRDYVWRTKEQQEQQVVTDYIADCLKTITDDVEIAPAKTVFAGKVVHLKSDITARIALENVSNSLDLLHPTPAVCGFPLLEAKNYILTNENYNRDFYTGFVGVVMSQKMDLFVNLRCLSYKPTQVTLYIGGGINAASNPQEEWQETVLKSTVLQQVLQQIC